MLFSLRITLLTLSFTLSLTPYLLSATAHANPSSPSINLSNAPQVSIFNSAKTSQLELSRLLAESKDRGINRESINRENINRENINRENINRESINRESINRYNAALSSLLAQPTDSLPALMETHIPNPTLISLGRPKVLIRSLSPVRLTLILTFDFGDA